MATKSKIPEAAMEYFRAQGARGGRKGAAARMEKMTTEERSAVARKAAAAIAKVRSAKAAKEKETPKPKAERVKP
jgi:hypothetical protein